MSDATPLENPALISDEKMIQDLFDTIDKPSLGHQLPDGTLNPEDIKAEIDNKALKVFMMAEVIEEKGKIGEVIDKFVETFPASKDLLSNLFNRQKRFKKYMEEHREKYGELLK